MLYDSRALHLATWEEQKETLIAEGWEFHPEYQGVIYIRKLIDNEPNTASPGWENKIE